MAIRQSSIEEIRYLKRKNLEQEAKIVGNMYRDQIHQQGIDCRYYKLDVSKFEDFKHIIDNNTIVRHAYGYDDQPNYSVSADMITFMEVENDIFQLNKYGLTPNMDVNFVFDSNDFACSLATKLGQYKEYKIDEINVDCEVPDLDPSTSADVFPYRLGLGYSENFTCGLLSGKLSVDINGYEIGKEHTVICHPYEHTDFKVEFPVNEYIYKSFKHKLSNDDFIDSMVFLTYKVERIKISENEYRYYLHGKIHGAILFYDISKIGKYVEKIHPDVGDIVTIDFPDETSREQYEITEAIDKQMTPDGINPFLHKYIWKCKARRYINSYEDIEKNEDNERLEDKLKYDSVVQEEIAKDISIYDDNEDSVYGGYENKNIEYDHDIPQPDKHKDYEYLDEMTTLDIMQFSCGSKLTTNGYDLYFVTSIGNAIKISFDNVDEDIKTHAYFESGLKHLKASDNSIVFINIEGRSSIIATNKPADSKDVNICLEALFQKTLQQKSINNDGDVFYKFNNTKTFLFATDSELFCRLANGDMYKLV